MAADVVRNVLVRIFGEQAGLDEAVGSASMGLAGFAAAAGAAALAVATALEQIGSKFDDMSDELSISTGASGAVLDGLSGTVKKVFQAVPTDLETATAAVAGLSQRLGLTGKPLDEMSERVARLSQLTGDDARAAVDGLADSFATFRVEAADQAGATDLLFRAYQQTGVSVGELAARIADMAPTLRPLGFGFRDAAALAATLAKAGLDAGDVMPALGKALAAAAKDGKPASEVFADLVDQIRRAPDDTAAAGLALDVLGAKAGPKFAGLVRQGQVDFAGMLQTLASGNSTILETGAATDDWREKLRLLLNETMVKLEPLATKVFETLGRVIDELKPKLEEAALAFSAWWDKNGENVLAKIRELWAKLWPTLKEAFQSLKSLMVELAKFWDEHGATIVAVVITIVGAVLENVTRLMRGIRAVFAVFGKLFDADWGGIWDRLVGVVGAAVGAIVKPFEGIGKIIVETLKRALNAVADLWNNTVGGWSFTVPVVGKISVPKMPKFALGTPFAPGGLALVGEAGPEIVELPRGSRVTPSGMSPIGGGGGSASVVVNLTIGAGLDEREVVAAVERGVRQGLQMPELKAAVA